MGWAFSVSLLQEIRTVSSTRLATLTRILLSPLYSIFCSIHSRSGVRQDFLQLFLILAPCGNFLVEFKFGIELSKSGRVLST
jgi:hypothetical protein